MNGWQALAAELDCWSETGQNATFWWRDDDAKQATPRLERLLTYAETVPVSLAVIPSLAEIDLAARLRGLAGITVLQHGWAHANHAEGGRSEYPPSRSSDEVSRELKHGRHRLVALFGEQCIAAFVPPWHSFDDSFLRLLPQSGIDYISCKGARSCGIAVEGLRQVNTHVAPIAWTSPPSFDDEDEYLPQFIDHLEGRRTGRYDMSEPTGLLTHHHHQNAASYRFIDRLVDMTLQHPAATWLSGKEVFRSR